MTKCVLCLKEIPHNPSDVLRIRVWMEQFGEETAVAFDGEICRSCYTFHIWKKYSKSVQALKPDQPDKSPRPKKPTLREKQLATQLLRTVAEAHGVSVERAIELGLVDKAKEEIVKKHSGKQLELGKEEEKE